MHKSAFLFHATEEKLTDELLNAAAELNLDSVFADWEDLTPESVKKIRMELPTAEIYSVVQVFTAKNLLEKFPDALPVDSNGKIKELVEKGEWYGGVCPSHPEVRKDRLDAVEKALQQDINGLWLDHLRYPTDWAKVEPEILDLCYCDRCLRLFEEYIGEPIEGVGGEGSKLENTALHVDGSYYHEWLEFKAGYIVSFVEEVRGLIKASGKPVKLGMFVVPWKDKEHGAGIQRVVAQDFSKLIPLIDVFSPMLYHKMVGRDVGWVKEMVDYFWLLGKPFLPLVQTENIPGEFGADEFSQALENASAKPSMGICIFFLEDLVKQPEKLAAAKKFFD